MKTLISLGDIDEVFYFLKTKGATQILRRLSPRKEARTGAAWNSAIAKRRTNCREIPAVQRRWNRMITGDEEKNYFRYFIEKFTPDNAVVLSPGCGTGEKEISLAEFSKIAQIDAFDLAEKRIEAAKEKAREKGIRKINFFVASIYDFKPRENYYDLIFFDSFLHHVENVGETLDRLSAGLRENGLLIINEYVGPNRFQWSDEQLKAANAALAKLPENLRAREFDGKIKRKIYRPGLLRMILSDPSEAVESETVLPEIRKRFETTEEKPYGGNILQLVLKDISHHFVEPDETAEKHLSELFDAEDEFISRHESDFVFGVYKLRRSERGKS